MYVVGKHELQWGNDLFVQTMTDKEENRRRNSPTHAGGGQVLNKYSGYI